MPTPVVSGPPGVTFEGMNDYIRARELEFERSPSSKAAELSAFVKAHHYSRSCPPGMHWFSAWHGAELVGVMLFRKPSLPRTGAAYGCDLELSRLVLLDEAGKNSESRFIGWALRWLKRNTTKRAVVSFADPRFGHQGVVYRASNWEFLGREKGHGTRRIVVDGEWLHPKTAYDRWGASGASLKKLLFPRTVEVVVCPPKNVYRYQLR